MSLVGALKGLMVVLGTCCAIVEEVGRLMAAVVVMVVIVEVVLGHKALLGVMVAVRVQPGIAQVLGVHLASEAVGVVVGHHRGRWMVLAVVIEAGRWCMVGLVGEHCDRLVLLFLGGQHR